MKYSGTLKLTEPDMLHCLGGQEHDSKWMLMISVSVECVNSRQLDKILSNLLSTLR